MIIYKLPLLPSTAADDEAPTAKPLPLLAVADEAYATVRRSCCRWWSPCHCSLLLMKPMPPFVAAAGEAPATARCCWWSPCHRASQSLPLVKPLPLLSATGETSATARRSRWWSPCHCSLLLVKPLPPRVAVAGEAPAATARCYWEAPAPARRSRCRWWSHCSLLLVKPLPPRVAVAAAGEAPATAWWSPCRREASAAAAAGPSAQWSPCCRRRCWSKCSVKPPLLDLVLSEAPAAAASAGPSAQ
jgi:hypothetical protein